MAAGATPIVLDPTSAHEDADTGGCVDAYTGLAVRLLLEGMDGGTLVSPFHDADAGHARQGGRGRADLGRAGRGGRDGAGHGGLVGLPRRRRRRSQRRRVRPVRRHRRPPRPSARWRTTASRRRPRANGSRQRWRRGRRPVGLRTLTNAESGGGDGAGSITLVTDAQYAEWYKQDSQISYYAIAAVLTTDTLADLGSAAAGDALTDVINVAIERQGLQSALPLNNGGAIDGSLRAAMTTCHGLYDEFLATTRPSRAPPAR